MPNPPAEFSAFAIARSMYSAVRMECSFSATMLRPAEAKMSPMKQNVHGTGGKEEERTTWPSQSPSLTPNETGAEPSARLQTSPWP